MRHEKIFKREDGSRVKLKVEIVMALGDNSQSPVYLYDVCLCEPGKVKWKPVELFDHHWKAISVKKRPSYKIWIFLKYVTEDEMLQTGLELWEKMKPDMLFTSRR
jgi:hypothetical protein